MIRRVVLYQPMTEAEAAAANAWTAKLGNPSMVISYVPSPAPMRALIFDAVNKPGKKRRGKNFIEDVSARVVAVLRVATASGQVMLNVSTGRDPADQPPAGNTHDALFVVAMPSGTACAFLARCGFGSSAASMASDACVSVKAGRRAPYHEIRSLFWPKKKPRDRRACEIAVIEYAEAMLADCPAVSGGSLTDPCQ